MYHQCRIEYTNTTGILPTFLLLNPFIQTVLQPRRGATKHLATAYQALIPPSYRIVSSKHASADMLVQELIGVVGSFPNLIWPQRCEANAPGPSTAIEALFFVRI
jgi:hypothetical protein